MVINMGLEIRAYLDDSDIAAKEAKWKGRLRDLNAEVTKFETRVRVAAIRGLGALGATVSMLRAVGQYFPAAITPIFDAVLTAVTTTVSAMTAIAAAYAAGGVTAPIAVIVQGAAIGLSVIGVLATIEGAMNAQQELQKMSSTLQSMGTMTQSWQQFFSSLG